MNTIEFAASAGSSGGRLPAGRGGHVSGGVERDCRQTRTIDVLVNGSGNELLRLQWSLTAEVPMPGMSFQSLVLPDGTEIPVVLRGRCEQRISEERQHSLGT